MIKPAENVIPWGLTLRFIYYVPQIVSASNRLIVVRHPRSKKPRIIRDKKAVIFREHIYASTLASIGDLKRGDPETFGSIRFPISGSECQLRVDVLFAFNLKSSGPKRMVESDIDNLKKYVYDGLEGTLIDNDRWITEGFVAKGQAAPVTKGDIIFLLISRAGFRDAKAIEFLYYNVDPLPPWRPQDQSRIIRPDSH